ncbi:MAG: hypothetical protein R3B40_24820 [Polyangiales bacterium]|nr:hypothetical protein [Sandaracinaceae bacterium]
MLTPEFSPWDEAAAAELCALVPGAESDAFRVARAVEGVPGLAFKDLDAALDELEGHAEVRSRLRRASNLAVAVVFGERAPR